MKIEIDLDDILGGEHGTETLQESVRRQVIANLEKTIRFQVQDRLNKETSRILDEQIQTAIAERVPALIDNIFNSEYTPVNAYGSRGEKTSFRAELIKAVNSQMVYRKVQYSSDENMFTKAVDELVKSKVIEFKADFSKEVNKQFTEECLKYAVEKLSERLGIKKEKS